MRRHMLFLSSQKRWTIQEMQTSPFRGKSASQPALLIAQAALLSGLFFLAAIPARAAVGDCGMPVSETEPKTSDCLFVLRAAVDIIQCAACTCDVNDSGEITAGDALLCLKAAVGQDVTLTCPPCPDPGCPAFVEWTTHAGIGETCETNEDCAIGNCDGASGRCRTASELDLGWTGTSHDIDLNEGSVLPLLIECDGDGSSCGACGIQGIDPSAGSCRCGNDTRVLCDEAFLPDAVGCPACDGGAFDGMACGANNDCEGGACAKHCAFDPEIVCATNSDCPTGRKVCDVAPACGTGDGSPCAVNSDCVGTCSGAAVCECFESPPLPVASVDFPFCIVARLAADVTGTIDVDTGESVLAKDLELVAYGGLSLLSPCPVCGGRCASDDQQPCSTNADCGSGDTCSLDPVARDGVRGGICIGGPHDGLACDVGATNASFPARPGGEGGGAYSLDCMPEADDNFTGPGLRVRVLETTGDSALSAEVPCDTGSPGEDCLCLTCSGNPETACNVDDDCALVRSCSELPEQGCDSNEDCQGFDLGTCTIFGNARCSGLVTRPCTTNGDCASVDFGTCDPATCSSTGGGETPKANECTNRLCEESEDGEGVCSIGPDDKACDGLVKADGGGIRYCITNTDCSADVLGFPAGACTLVERRECFLDTVAAEGAIDAAQPLVVATFCVPPGVATGANTSIGLPGPARLERQSTLVSYCASDPEVPYVPGSSACP